MKIQMKLYAMLGKYLPDNAVRNEVEIDVDAETSVEGLLEDHGVPLEHCHLVLVNGIYAAPGERKDKILSEGDAVAVWPPVAGG